MGIRKLTRIIFVFVLCFYGCIFVSIFKAIHLPTTFRPIKKLFFNDLKQFGYDHQTQREIKQISSKPSNVFGSDPCKEKQNLVFIKCMKCATESMGTVIRRFGFTRNLSFVLPVGKHIYLGWPYLMEKEDYRPPRRGSSCPNCSTGYNILMEHAIYNRTIMSRLMPTNTMYISIIREPYAHFLSTFYYFGIKGFVPFKGTNYISEYLKNYHKYEAIYKSKTFREHNCIPSNFSITQNLMSHCLGMPLGFPPSRKSFASYSPQKIMRYLQELDRDFYLVLLVEYFDTSLVLLRRLMCWEMKDIIYHKSNEGNYEEPNGSNNRQMKQNRKLHMKYSQIDYLLYEHFNRTFWKKVQQQTSDFFDEVKCFKKIQADVAEFCQLLFMKKSPENFITIKQSPWNNAFNFTKDDCILMYRYLLVSITKRYDKEMGALGVSKENRNRSTC